MTPQQLDADRLKTAELAEKAKEALDDLLVASQFHGENAPCCPIAYGTIAFGLGKAEKEAPDVAGQPATHRWSVYVRSPNGDDLSWAIQKVVFTLHDSFKEPVREVTQQPYEITEFGWGAFEIQIRIHFHDESLPPVNLAHLLKLRNEGAQGAATASTQPVVSEFYDEIVFNQVGRLPAPLQQQLLRGPQQAVPPTGLEYLFPEFSAEGDLATLAAAHAFVAAEAARLTERLTRAQAEGQQLRQDLEVLGYPARSKHVMPAGATERRGPTPAPAAAAATAGAGAPAAHAK